MNMSDDPREVLNAATRFELEGHKILVDAKDKALDPLSKATFQFLADQELKHIEMIKAFVDGLTQSGEFAPDAFISRPITKQEAREQISGLFADFKAQFEATSGMDAERQAVYDVAMNMECKGHDFYKAAAEQASNQIARKLYLFLEGEETKHFEIIQDTADFLKQPDAFMAVDERWMQI